MNSRSISLAVVFASLYYVLGLVFQSISFLAIQVRVAQVLIPFITLFGAPALIGISIGHIIFNLSSPLGFLDWLSPFVLLVPRLLIWRYGLVFLPLHVVVVGLWVGYALNTALGIPLLPTAVTVGAGEAVAEGLGLPLLYAVKRRLAK